MFLYVFCVIYFLSFQLAYGFSAEHYRNINDNLKADIVSIKLFLKEEEIPRLIVESMFGDDAVLNKQFKYSTIMFSDVATVLLDTFTINLKQALKLMDIKWQDIYKLIVWCKVNWKSIKTTMNVTETYQILDNSRHLLNVSQLHLHAHKIKMPAPEEAEFDIVNNNSSLNDFLKVLISNNFQILLIKLNNNKKTKSLITDFKRLIRPTNMLKLLKILNITADNFYRSEAFARFLRHVLNFKEPVTGTFVSSNKVITFLYEDYLKKYSRMFVETSETFPMRYEVEKVSFSPTNIAILKVERFSKHGSIQEPENVNYNLLTNCTYITRTINNLLHVEYCSPKLDRDSNILYVAKMNLSTVSLGSPLICKKCLYGVANFEDENHVEFIPIYSEKNKHKEL